MMAINLKRLLKKSTQAPKSSKKNRPLFFSLFYKTRNTNDNETSLKLKIFASTIITICVCVTGLVVLGQYATLDFTLITAALLCVCGLVVYDILSRKRWQKDISQRLNKLVSNHDRLVREVARNRNDIGLIKENLSETSNALEIKARRLPPSSSSEAKLLEILIEQLGAIGDQPRSIPVKTPYNQNVMELEVQAPPKRRLSHNDTKADEGFEPETLSDPMIADIVRSAVRDDNIDIFVQPVVSLPQRKPKLFEIYARIRTKPGSYISASRYIELAQKEQLVPAIDNLLLLKSLELLKDRRNLRADLPYMLNISADTLSDTGFMNDLVTFLSENRSTASRLIFELSQSDITSYAKEIKPLIDGLSQLGCRFSMDDIRDGTLNINLLKSLRIRFIKMDSTWLIREGYDRKGMSRILRLKKQLDQAGIDLIVERVETEEQVRELLDFAVDYGQGYLFGKPDMYAAYRDMTNRERQQLA
jgi:cyclic-di-GMP phosphodiesterase TipF (flagellum assembly factor)